MSSIVADIRALMQSLSIDTIAQISSKANGAAIRMARLAKIGRSVEFCLFAVPEFISDVLIEDRCNAMHMVRGTGITPPSHRGTVNNNGNSV